ncbi:polyphosphate kinase 1 [Lentisphaerota bacterium ZTH]|nr:polyphosphate kinase 1 [Lentisphaerota bacterium]WET07343.1 polyphosphate kinase 1 [Lentisphaerota bacterium ZTH]
MSKKKPENFGSEIFLSRELSWLDFNSRVLDEAGFKANPLLERLKFIAIYSSNLDEFFMVRVAGLRQLVKINSNTPDPAGLTPEEQLVTVREKVEGEVKRQYRYLMQQILPALEKNKVRLRKPGQLSANCRKELTNFFNAQVFPVLTPIAVDPSHPFPMLNNGSIEIVVSMIPHGMQETVYAFVEVPEVLPRFIKANDGLEGDTYVLLEDIIMDNLQALFVNCKIDDYFPFRITRDMDFAIEEEGVEDLLHSIEKTLLERRSREPIRLEMPAGTSGRLAEWLQHEFQLDSEFRYSISGPLHLKQFFELADKVTAPKLKEASWTPLPCPGIDPQESIFKSIDENGPICISLPYHSFDPVVRMIEEAADDPDVMAIKQTLYRVSGDSPVVKALQRAAENGKQVTVIVELKARFDEGNNILWARRLEESGAHVVYGISGLKIHCKALLVVRKEDGLIKRYVHLSTGNYNDRTAKLYTDIGMMSDNPRLCADISALFNIMTGYSSPMNEWHKIEVAPFGLRRKFLALIDRETRLSTPENPGRIIAKMNSLVDPEIIRHLYAAAHAGVQIDLIVRGICCLRPDVETENIRVMSIVDRFLEHSRIFFFGNGGEPEYFLASADWMPRNLDRRIELLFPVENQDMKDILQATLDIQLEDREKGRILRNNGTYSRRFMLKHSRYRSQWRTYELLQKMSTEEFVDSGEKLKIFTDKGVLAEKIGRLFRG